mgnify:CR=1 FL=1
MYQLIDLLGDGTLGFFENEEIAQAAADALNFKIIKKAKGKTSGLLLYKVKKVEDENIG